MYYARGGGSGVARQSRHIETRLFLSHDAEAPRRAMAREPKPKPDDPEQSKRFIEAAREAGADETEEGADRGFKSVAPRKPAQPKASPYPR